ncbi:hypothetical protein [Mesorhizobium sp. BR1-1-3]|nr:hypothetical protein [Mesorhizobium sp. BR1-1-3]
MEDLIDPEYDDTIPPPAARYAAVWITIGIVLLPLIAWSLLK